jgi:hypothetical protein
LLPIVPRPFEDELFSSWQGRVACRYDLSGDGLSEWLGVGGCDRRVIDFARRDFSPAGDVIVSWAKACRLPEEQLREMILSTRPRPQGWYVWGEGTAAGAHRRPVCLACLDADADAGRDHHLRRSWALVEACICDRHKSFLSEACPYCLSNLGFRFKACGGLARLVCARCDRAARRLGPMGEAAPSGIQSFFGTLAGVIAQASDDRRSRADSLMRAARLLWARPSGRGGSGTPFIAGLVPGVPRLPSTEARVDRSEPLATVSLGWRIATLMGVAQLLDLGEAQQHWGPPPFTFDQLAEWTGEARPAARPKRIHPVASGLPHDRGPIRTAAEYRALAETILASAEWRSVQGRDPAERRRKLGSLMSRALDRARPVRAVAPGRAEP